MQEHWFHYTERVDCILEEAIRLNVKRSLQVMSRTINGDGKSAPDPVFKVRVILDKEKVRKLYISNIHLYTISVLQCVKKVVIDSQCVLI